MTKEEAITFMVEAIGAKNNGEDIDFILPGFLAKPLASFHSMR